MLAQRGEVQGFFPATIKKERLEWAEPSKVIADQKWVWYLPATSKLDPLSPEFKARPRSAPTSAPTVKMLEADNFNVVLKPQTDELLLLAFKLGRADAILGGDLAIAAAMKEHGIDPKAFRTVVAQDSPLHAYFGKQFLQAEPGFLKRLTASCLAVAEFPEKQAPSPHRHCASSFLFYSKCLSFRQPRSCAPAAEPAR